MTVVAILASVVGFFGGWRLYWIVLFLLSRANKGRPLFGWREAVFSGILLIAIGLTIGLIQIVSQAPPMYHIVELFAGSIAAGAGAFQLWLCWEAVQKSKSR